MKKIILTMLISAIMSLVLVSAISVSLTPASISMTLKPNEIRCQNVWFSIGNNGVTFSDNINNKLIITYPKEASNGKTKVCFQGKVRGKYSGFIYLTEKTNSNFRARVGIRTNIIIK